MIPQYVITMLTVIFEAIITVMFVKAYEDEKEDGGIRTYAVCVVLFVVLSQVINRMANLSILNILLLAALNFSIAFVYNKSIKTDIILAIILTVVFSITEVFTLFTIVKVSGVTVRDATEIYEYRMLGTILSKLFAFIVLKLISVRHDKRYIFAMKTSYWILFCMTFVFTLLTIYLLFIFQYHSMALDIYKNLSILCGFGLLYSTFFSLYLYENVEKHAEADRDREVFRQQIKNQSKHLDDILITQNHMKKMYHDLKNHNISIQSFFENGDCKAGLEYMNNLNSYIQLSDSFVETGNSALDAIINTKRGTALSRGIDFKANIQIPENMFVDAVDICIIFGNALDNCIEACDKVKNRDKKIEVSIVYDDNSLICKIINTAVKEKTAFLSTTKKDKSNHGFGIGNIESSLSKYKSICRYTQDDENFILSFVIFNKQ